MARWVAVAAVALLSAAGSALLAACGSSSSAEPVSLAGSANTRHSGGPIDSSSVSRLEIAWTVGYKVISPYGVYTSPPVVSQGVVYSQDPESDVQAIDLETGEVLWTKKYELPDPGPNGVAVAGERVYGSTPTSAFALDRKTGKQLWSVPLTRNKGEEIDMSPGYNAGKVYLSTTPGIENEYQGGGEVGVLWALDGRTGKKLWHFDTVPRGLWGNPRVNSGGGLRSTPAFDQKGSMYFGVGSPVPLPGVPGFPWGKSRPGPNLYTDSVVKLDAKTGKMQWYYQVTPHDVYNWDMQGPAMLMNVDGRQLVLAGSKAGIVIALDAESGELVWEQRVGRHNGYDDDSLYAMKGEYSELEDAPTIYPGNLGGVTAPMATDGAHVFLPMVNHPFSIGSLGTETREYSATNLGELIALNLRTGEIEWNQEFFRTSPRTPVTSVNDLVFITEFDGDMRAFDAESGDLVWETKLPAGTNTGVTVSGDTLLAAAGLASGENEIAQLVAYRLGG